MRKQGIIKNHDEGRLNHAILLAYIEAYPERRDGPDRVSTGRSVWDLGLTSIVRVHERT